MNIKIVIERDLKTFVDQLETADVAWIFSGSSSGEIGETKQSWDFSKADFLRAIEAFHESGRGLALFTSGDPLYTEANAVLSKLYSVKLTNKVQGSDKMKKPAQNSNPLKEKKIDSSDEESDEEELDKKALETTTNTESKSLLTQHSLFYGVDALTEATVYSTLTPKGNGNIPEEIRTVATSSSGAGTIFIREHDTYWPPKGRLLIDSAFRYYLSAEQSINDYYCNAAVWLLSLDIRIRKLAPIQGSLLSPDTTVIPFSS